MKRKIVTICGSLKYVDKIQQIAEKLELEKEYVVLNIIPHTMDRALTKPELKLLGDLHREKIDISDAIFVVNIGGYIGEAVAGEIEYAKKKGKEVFYLEG